MREPGEWCHERFELNLEPFSPSRVFGNVSGFEGQISTFMLWGEGINRDVWQNMSLSFEGGGPPHAALEFLGIRQTPPNPRSNLVAADLYANSNLRTDFILENALTECGENDVVVGPHRAAEVQRDPPIFAPKIRLDLCIGNPSQLVAVRLSDGDADEVVVFDHERQRFALHVYDDPGTDWALAAEFPIASTVEDYDCNAVNEMLAADFDGDGNEEVIIIPRGCPPTSPGVLLALGPEQPGERSLVWGDPLPAPGLAVESLERGYVSDLNEDGISDLVVVGDGQLAHFLGGDGGLSEPVLLDAAVAAAPGVDAEKLEGALPPIRVAVGTFDNEAGQEIVVGTEAGVSVLTLDGVLVHELEDPAYDFAAVDVNGDEVSDLMVLGDTPTVHISSPY